MKRFIQGEDRSQVTLLPECLDDYIAEDNPVRVVDAYVEELDLEELAFAGAEPAATGRPAYHPAVLLKIYILSLIHISEPTRLLSISYAVFCLKKKKIKHNNTQTLLK